MSHHWNGTDPAPELGAHVSKDEETGCYVVRCPSLGVVTAVKHRRDAEGAVRSAANLIKQHRFRTAISTVRNNDPYDVTIPLAAV